MWLELGLGLGIPATGLAIAIGRYFWKKEKCFIAMKTKIDELSSHDANANEDHGKYEERLTLIEKNQQKWIIYLQLLLKDRGISYEK